MTWIALSLAWAGSITLEVEAVASKPDTVDFGRVSAGAGGEVGLRYDGPEGSFFVVEVAATAHWEADPMPDSPSLVDTPVFSPGFGLEAPVRGVGLNAPRFPARLSYLESSPPPLVDLYVQIRRDYGTSQVWVAPAGTRWGFDAATRVSGLPVMVERGLSLGVPYVHEVALEVTPRDHGRQEKEIVYTAIIP